MEAEFRPTWLGKLRAFLYRPAACYISYRFVGDPTEYYSRFITCMGRSGCMVTPFIHDNPGVLRFYQPGDDLDALKRIEVFGFSCDPGDEKYFKQRHPHPLLLSSRADSAGVAAAAGAARKIACATPSGALARGAAAQPPEGDCRANQPRSRQRDDHTAPQPGVAVRLVFQPQLLPRLASARPAPG